MKVSLNQCGVCILPSAILIRNVVVFQQNRKLLEIKRGSREKTKGSHCVTAESMENASFFEMFKPQYLFLFSPGFKPVRRNTGPCLLSPLAYFVQILYLL